MGAVGHPSTEALRPQLLGVLAADSSQLSSYRESLSAKGSCFAQVCACPLFWGQLTSKGWWEPKACPFSRMQNSSWAPQANSAWRGSSGHKYAPVNLLGLFSGNLTQDCGQLCTCLWIHYLKGWEWRERINFCYTHLHMNSLITMSTYCFYNFKNIIERNLRCNK